MTGRVRPWPARPKRTIRAPQPARQGVERVPVGAWGPAGRPRGTGRKNGAPSPLSPRRRLRRMTRPFWIRSGGRGSGRRGALAARSREPPASREHIRGLRARSCGCMAPRAVNARTGGAEGAANRERAPRGKSRRWLGSVADPATPQIDRGAPRRFSLDRSSTIRCGERERWWACALVGAPGLTGGLGRCPGAPWVVPGRRFEGAARMLGTRGPPPTRTTTHDGERTIDAD